MEEEQIPTSNDNFVSNYTEHHIIRERIGTEMVVTKEYYESVK